MVPLQAHRMRLRHATSEDGEWLRAVLERVSGGFGSRVGRDPDGALGLRL